LIVHNRGQLKELVMLHGIKNEDNPNPLTHHEIVAIRGALDMNEKSVEETMIPLEKALMLSENQVIDEETIIKVAESHFHHYPVHEAGNRGKIVGVLGIQTLLRIDRANPPTVGSLMSREFNKTQKNQKLFPLLNDMDLKEHPMIIVYDREVPVGIITLSDITMEMTQIVTKDRSSTTLEINSDSGSEKEIKNGNGKGIKHVQGPIPSKNPSYGQKDVEKNEESSGLLLGDSEDEL